MPVKLLRKSPLELLNETQKQNIKNGIDRFNDILKKYGYLYFFNLIKMNFPESIDITIVDEFIRNLTDIFNPDYAMFFLNSLMNFNVNYINFIKDLKIKGEEKYIDTNLELYATFGPRLRRVLSRMFGEEDWKRIHSDLIIKDDYYGHKSQIILNNGKTMSFLFNNTSIISFISNIFLCISNSIKKINKEILSQIRTKDFLLNIKDLIKDINQRISDLNKSEDLKIIEEEIEEFSHEILIVEGNIKCKIYFRNYKKLISFNFTIDSIFILIEHFLKRILDIGNKISIDLLLEVSKEELANYDEKIDEILGIISEMETNYKDSE
ncbi:MAG: hypothetical protein ACFFDN_17180 [Candidatus Hodarchaeota archaeon]